MQNANKLIKLICLLGVIIMSSSCISACYADREAYIEKALYEKYDKKFSVKKIGNSKLASNSVSYQAFVYPNDDKELLFEVTAKDDKSRLHDGYKQALLQKQLQKDAKISFDELNSKYEIIIDVNSINEGYTEGTSLSDYSEQIICNTILAININDNITPTGLYNTLVDTFVNWKNVKGTLSVYLVDNEQIKDIHNFKKESPRIDSTLLDLCGDIEFSTDILDGKLVKTEKDLEAALY